jgi:hypothetical protein
MAFDVSTLMIQVAADTSRLASDMQGVKSQVTGTMQDVSGAVDMAKKAFIALGGYAGVKMFAGMVASSIEAVGTLHDLAQTTGVSAAALSGLAAVGRTTGTTAEEIAGKLTKMAKNLAVASEESKGSAEAVKALGLNFEDFRKLKPDEQLLEVAKAQEKFADGAGKAAAMESLMGKGAAALIPYMHDLAATGAVNAEVTDAQAAAADEFGDNLASLKGEGEGWKRTLSLGMLPALNDAAKATLGVFKESGGLRDQLRKLNEDGSITRWTRAAITGLTYVMDMVSGLVRVFKTVGQSIGYSLALVSTSVSALAAAARKLLVGDFGGALEEVRGGLSQAKAIAKDFGGVLSDIWSEETTGQKIRARMAEMEKFTAAAQDVKPALDMRPVHEANATAAKKHNEELEKIVVTAKRLNDGNLEAIKITAKHIEVMTDAERAAEANTKAAAEWQKQVQSVTDGLTDALFEAFENGKSFAAAFLDTLKATFNTLVLRPTIETIMAPVGQLIGGVMRPILAAIAGITGGGTASAASALTGGGGGGIGSYLSMASSALGLTGVGSTFGAGLGFGMAGWGAGGMGFGATMGAGTSMISGGIAGGSMSSVAGGLGTWAGALGPYALAAAAIQIMGSKMYDAGWTGDYGDKNQMPGMDTKSLLKNPLRGSMMLAPKYAQGLLKGLGLSDSMSAIWSGATLANYLFGRKAPEVASAGLDLNMSGGEVDGSRYQKVVWRGGLFTSTKKKEFTSPLGEDADKDFAARAQAIFEASKIYATAIGAPVEALKDVSTSIRIKFTKDDAENAKLIDDAFASYQEALSGGLSKYLEPFRQAGETLTQTLERLANLAGASAQINEFGGVFSRIAALSVSAKEELAAFAGGMDALIAKIQGFVSGYYSEAEQFGITARQVSEVFTDLGIDPTSITSRADFRSLVESRDVSTTEGREQLNALLDLAGTFGALADYLAKSGGTLATLSDLAPQTEILGALVADSVEQTDLATQTVEGVDRLNDSVTSIGDQITEAIAGLGADLTTALVTVAANTADVARQLTRWDNNGQMSTTTEAP